MSNKSSCHCHSVVPKLHRLLAAVLAESVWRRYWLLASSSRKDDATPGTMQPGHAITCGAVLHC